MCLIGSARIPNRNLVAKHSHTFNKAKTHTDKKKESKKNPPIKE